MEPEEVNIIRKIVNELISRLPNDCQDLAIEHFNQMLKELRDKGIEKAIRDWYIDQSEEVELIPTR
ncbi:hypothetical protein [Metallosphaera hakonensis]|uniref:Uncharacterized protein n=1 Tax=Metallosphaera hakonensis JCM 8857 = DSM 7519 TaxID=1293036 RepID=A0A2U9IVJ2_9CREN|nr:hypothetical protein [Metallosphaera hakonensis]AWS00092.1 hypothetical protein DFR87_10815 [Metallosphaera hakonensis JCM 8857 = DSM 7519]